MPTALVTGASSGIGRAVAADLLAAGWELTAVARDPGRGRLAGAQEVAADLADEDACRRAVEAHRERFGRLDLLVNGAGVSIGAPVDEVATSDWDRQFAVNVRGLFLVTRGALPLLREARGLIVNVASISGLRAGHAQSAYVAAKHAVVGFTRALNEDLRGTGVRATAVCPHFVASPMTAWIADRVPFEEMIQPEDVARTVRFLLELSPVCLVPEVPIDNAFRLESGSPPASADD